MTRDLTPDPADPGESGDIVAQLNPNRRPAPGLSRRTKMQLFLTADLLIAAIFLVPAGPIRGAFSAALVIFVIGCTIAWLSRTGPRLSSSGRDMGDFRRNNDGFPR